MNFLKRTGDYLKNMNFLERIGGYLTEEQPNFIANNQILAPLIAMPEITCKYYQGEIVFGLLYNFTFVAYCWYSVLPKMYSDYAENTQNCPTIVMAQFLVMSILNFLGILPKLYIIYRYRCLVLSIDTLSTGDLRRSLIGLLKTRIYGMNFKLSSWII